MLKKILGTIGSRYLIAFLNLLLIFINAKVLGAEGVGLIGILMAAVNISVIFNSILCGSTIVYFMNRYSMQTIFWPAYIWAGMGSGVACLLLYLLDMVPDQYLPDVFFLSILNSLVTANARFLLGKDHIKGFNWTYILQGGLLFFVLMFFYFGLDKRMVGSYLNGLYVTNLIALIVSLVLLYPYWRERNVMAADTQSDKSLFAILREMFAYGLWAGADNLAENFTTRLNYFLIQRFSGLGSVGLLDAGTKISESVCHISRSVSFIEYSSIARTADREEQRQITLKLFKLTYCAVAFVMFCILLIPEWVYTDYLFSPEFVGMRKVIVGLSIGIIALGSNSILGHYFIGSGKIRYSAACSCIGLLTLLIAGYILIPLYGVVGSAVSTSIAFVVMLSFSLIVFTRQTQTRFSELIPSRSDWNYIRRKILSSEHGSN